ncbi:MAG: calcium-binding protein [Hyphomicrobiaceae bacterium]
MATIKGTNSKNKLVSKSAGDTLLGLGGNDILLGNGGNDTIKGGTGNDTASGGSGNDKIYGEAGNDTLRGGTGNDTIDGGSGLDKLFGDAGTDTLKGGAGNDILTGGTGNDKIFGGSGTDTATFSGLSTASTITQVGSNLIVTGANGVDTVAADVEFLKFSDGTFAATAKTFNLTSSNDTFTGGLRNDTFVGLINTQFPFNTTYSGGDVLDGGGGTGDVLQISVAGINNSGSTFAPPISLSNIEIVRVLNQESNGGFTSLDASIWSGVQTVVAQSGVLFATTEIFDLGNLVSAEMKNNSSNLTLSYDTSVLIGLDDVQLLTLTANNDGIFEIVGGIAETLDIVSQIGPNQLYLDFGNNHQSINITGNQRLVLDTASMISLTTLNAGGMSGGGVEVYGLEATNGTLAVTGSSVDDTFIFTSMSLDSDDAVDGGGGTGDVLAFAHGAGLADADFGGVANVETVAFGGGSPSTLTLDAAAAAAGIGTVLVYGDDTSIDLTVGADFTHALSVNLDAFDAPDLPPVFPGFDSVDASAMLAAHKLTVSALGDSIDGNSLIAGANAGDELILTADGGDADLSGLRNFEVVTVNGGTGTGAPNDIRIDLFNNSVVASGETLTINAGGGTGLTNSNARLVFDGSAELDGHLDVTGGAGVDNIVGGQSNDTLRGGANNDILTAGLGDDMLLGGTGDDEFILDGNLTAADTVNGEAGAADELYISSSVLDGAFTNVINVETLALGTGISVELGAEANGGGGGLTGGGFNRVEVSGSGDAITVGAGFTNALTVDLTNGGFNTLTATAKSAGAITVVADASDLADADILLANAAIAGNTLQIRADNGTADLSGASGFSTLTVLAGATATDDITINVNADSVVASGAILTVNAAALTNAGATLTFDGSAETNGRFNITGGAGNDDITDGGANDTINTGGGNDTIRLSGGSDLVNAGAGEDAIVMSAANLSSLDTIDGGANTTTSGDVLELSGTDTVVDTQLTNVTNVETLRRTAGATTTLDAQAFNGGSGIKQFIGMGDPDVVNIGAGYTGAITVDFRISGGGFDTVDASTSSAVVTVQALSGDASNDTFKGGTTAGDVIKLTANGATSTFGADDSGFETITAVAIDASNLQIVITDDTFVSAATGLTINGTAMTSGLGQLGVDGSAVTSSTKALTVTGGAQADTITGGAGADTLNGGDGGDFLVGGLGNDTINAGDGSDTVVAGLGNDTINLGAQVGTSDIDRVIFDGVTTGVATVTAFDAADGVSSEDIIDIDGFADFAANTTVRASTAGGPVDARLVILDNNPGGYSNIVLATNDADILQNAEGSANNRYLFVWNDTSGAVHVSMARAELGLDLGNDLVKLAGVSLANLDLSDFDFIA